MKDPTCLYCADFEKRDSLMIPICDLEVSQLFLFREQTYYGRVLVAYKEHAKEIFELSDDDMAAFMRDVCKAACAVNATVHPAKVNLGMYSDKLPHLHCHIAPKQVDGYGYGGTFEMNVNPPKYLSDEEYASLIAKIKANLK